ncbi:methyl-accepting chemotaxis protein [Ruminiclostridium cellulolyticum]|uniref:Methyl-accepting chemotaxis sensory transducer n=1 Tax=Ruminiclostridium cellulolyticum (strain ATCC 35319 / DSM 5812 / JCM 6584 / H10) TaxID=394503 RepID=B8I412_RUMCH|nr:methyl-accepting chemotaxis protein [Ruminiclostridium cellulolyticum]ACL76445.1 methyl-accepting chemotaxis sensory transducer [Ruminiclostridium cellulolyticum H10]
MSVTKICRKIKNTNIRLRIQLLIVLITVTLIPIIAVSTTTYITTIGKITELSLNNLKSDSYNTMSNIELKIKSLDSTIKGVASQTDFLVGLEMANSVNEKMDTVTYSGIQLSMKNVVEGSEGLIQTMYLCNKRGKVIATAAKRTKTAGVDDFYNMQLFESIKKDANNEVIVGNSIILKGANKKVIPVTRAVKSLAGFSGTITALVDYEKFFKFGKNQIESEIIILDSGLKAFYGKDNNEINSKIPIKEAVDDENITYMDSGTKKIAHLYKSDLTNWIVCAQMDYSKVMLPVKQYILILIIVLVLSLLLAAFISIFYSKYISSPVVELTRQIKKVEDGFLEVHFEKRSNISEINSLTTAFENMVRNLNILISGISSASKEIDEMSALMYSEASESFEKSEFTQKSISNINVNIKDQADNTSNATVEIKSLAEQIATTREHSNNVYNFLDRLNNSAKRGKSQMDKLEANSTLNLQSISKMNEMIIGLQTQMKQINTITAAIQSVAKQTQLLSLNARIEASRAGESGKGFAVVADEIKELSIQTNSQAGVIRNMIESIVQNSNNLTKGFEEVSKGTDSQNSCINETKDCFLEIKKNIDNINSRLFNITDYLQEMDKQKDNLVLLVNQINNAAVEIAHSSDHVHEYTKNHIISVKKVHEKSNIFKSLSQKLNSSVGLFKV